MLAMLRLQYIDDRPRMLLMYCLSTEAIAGSIKSCETESSGQHYVKEGEQVLGGCSWQQNAGKQSHNDATHLAFWDSKVTAHKCFGNSVEGQHIFLDLSEKTASQSCTCSAES